MVQWMMDCKITWATVTALTTRDWGNHRQSRSRGRNLNKGSRLLCIWYRLDAIENLICGAHPASYAMDTGVPSRELSGRGLKLIVITHLHVVARLRMSGEILQLPLYDLMVLTETTLPVPVTIRDRRVPDCHCHAIIDVYFTFLSKVF